MKSNYLILGSFLAAIITTSVHASDAKSSCTINNYQQLVDCATANSSNKQIADQQLKTSYELKNSADQWINPEISIERLSKDSQTVETSASLLFTLRLGGKANALSKIAQSEINRSKANYSLQSQNIRLEIILSLYRLSHLKKEIQIESESGETFEKIIQQYQKKPVLSPEQEVSLTIFKMALGDHQLKLTQLKSDENAIYEALVSVTQIPRKVIGQNLPMQKSNWPEVIAEASTRESPQLLRSAAELELAQSELDKAQSDAWPDLKIGPSFKRNEMSGTSENYSGIGLSLSLPIFSLNGGEKAYRRQKVIEAENEFNLAKNKDISLKTVLQEKYRNLLMALKNLPSSAVLNQKHEYVEKQFFKGLISSSLVIEAHRQLFELEERRNSSELSALETYGQLMILSNQMSETNL